MHQKAKTFNPNSYNITSTSPSLYLQILGTAAVSDQCTSVGPTLIDPIITLSPGEILTWRPTREGFAKYHGPGKPFNAGYKIRLDIFGIDAPLDVKDLACPTWGLGKATSADGTVFTTIESPFLPLIIAPKKALSLDPTWAFFCTDIATDGLNAGIFFIFDPPHALTPGSNSVETPTSATVAQGPAINPANPTTGPDLTVTPITSTTKPAPHDFEATPSNTVDSQSSHGGSGAFPTNKNDPPTGAAVIPTVIAGQTITSNPSAFSIAGTVISAEDPAITVDGTIFSLGTSGDLAIGGTICSLLAPTPTRSLSPNLVTAGQTITPNPSASTWVSLESGGKTLDVGCERFAIPTSSTNGTAGQQFLVGGQRRGREMSLVIIFSAWISWVLIAQDTYVNEDNSLPRSRL